MVVCGSGIIPGVPLASSKSLEGARRPLERRLFRTTCLVGPHSEITVCMDGDFVLIDSHKTNR
jgi:hypothetical protein